MVNREHAQKLWNNLLELGTKRLILLAVAASLCLAALAAARTTISRPGIPRSLFGSQPRGRDACQLGAARREYRFRPEYGGRHRLCVRPGQTAQARTLLGGQGPAQHHRRRL